MRALIAHKLAVPLLIGLLLCSPIQNWLCVCGEVDEMLSKQLIDRLHGFN